MKLVTVHTSFSPTDAQLIRSRLEAANFHAQVANETSIVYAGFSKSSLIRVEVPESEAAEAKDLLAAAETAE